jgi:hypothetical protein
MSSRMQRAFRKRESCVRRNVNNRRQWVTWPQVCVTWGNGSINTVPQFFKLLQNAYAPVAIAKMYEEALEDRELIRLTWFRGLKAVISAKNLVAMKVKDPNKKDDVKHGFVFADIAHVPERHLYKHFQFGAANAIKAANSFHPRGTKQEAISTFANDNTVEETPDVLQSVANMRVVVTGQAAAARILSIYPNLAPNDPDHYDTEKLTRIKNVIYVIANNYQNPARDRLIHQPGHFASELAAKR